MVHELRESTRTKNLAQIRVTPALAGGARVFDFVVRFITIGKSSLIYDFDSVFRKRALIHAVIVSLSNTEVAVSIAN